jgi:uncharacterized protein DUF4062
MTPPIRKIRIMLSSRNNDLIPEGDVVITLSEVRKELQKELQEEIFCGRRLLEVWINEEAGAEGGDDSAWDTCMTQVEEADIVVAIYNGHAGWRRKDGDVGICHAEMQRALSLYPAKLRVIQLRFATDKKLKLTNPEELKEKTDTNRRFAEYFKANARFVGFAHDRESLREQVLLAIAKALSDYVVTLARREMHKGKFHLGSPLDWSRLSYLERKFALEQSVKKYLLKSEKATEVDNELHCSLGGAEMVFRVHGVPANFGTAEARDLVGRPFLTDHLSSVKNPRSGVVGPLHFIACHKGCTESQLVSFLGHPDLFIVQPPFGFFVADQASFVQAFFLINCRDDTTTRLAMQSLFEWIEQSGETNKVIQRAKSRAAILQTVAAEIERLKGAESAVLRRGDPT